PGMVAAGACRLLDQQYPQLRSPPFETQGQQAIGQPGTDQDQVIVALHETCSWLVRSMSSTWSTPNSRSTPTTRSITSAARGVPPAASTSAPNGSNRARNSGSFSRRSSLVLISWREANRGEARNPTPACTTRAAAPG